MDRMVGERCPQSVVAGSVARRTSIRGIVQGVGFRPFVYNLANRLGVHGWIVNNSSGVEIHSEGQPETLDAFQDALVAEAPPLAQILVVAVRDTLTEGEQGFDIRRSEREQGAYQLVSPDVATCGDCLTELFDPTDRRYRYPFTNCTNCGPRFTIILDMPYDRPGTTMRSFPMCQQCQGEYEDPANRRFHAQPNACPVCGPHLWLTDATGRRLSGSHSGGDNQGALEMTRDLLLAGGIVAVKGLGGFLLACDAGNDVAVSTLRLRKRRPHKPFAIMVRDVEETERLCYLSSEERALLTSSQRPIVLLGHRPVAGISAHVAPSSQTLGVMLPYTPLHHILMHDINRPLVMTSGNLSEEPIAADNDEALQGLGHLVDAFLMHNRDIHSRYDDSVWHVVDLPNDAGKLISTAQPLRRARGYAPLPLQLPFQVRPLLAAGADLKNTFCLTRDQFAFLSQHVGDMENLETLEHHQGTLDLYQHLFDVQPGEVVCDLHPDYLSTRACMEYVRRHDLPQPTRVQHHHAHIAACLADNGWMPADGMVIGVAMDGTGLGSDGQIWGGEWLVGDYHGFRRVAQLEYLPLVGGDAAIRKPWRIAAGYLYALLGSEAIPNDLLSASARRLMCRQVDEQINTPLTSSMGRLFDAVSALLGICREASYEAQGAIELEQAACLALVGEPPATETGYPIHLDEDASMLRVRLRTLLEVLLHDIQRGVAPAKISLRFHVSIARMILKVCGQIRNRTGLRTVALSGGCFQSRLLTKFSVRLLRERGFDVLIHHQVPCNDGGLSLGQAVLAHYLGNSER